MKERICPSLGHRIDEDISKKGFVMPSTSDLGGKGKSTKYSVFDKARERTI